MNQISTSNARVFRGVQLVWRDAPAGYGPHKMIYNGFRRWSRLDVINQLSAEPATKGGQPDQLMFDSTHLWAHQMAASLIKGRRYPDESAAHQRLLELRALSRLQWHGLPVDLAAQRTADERLQGGGGG
ncbi:MAG: hypothetical protein V2J51_06320, partial [Erythrobacter sp.]|nr:hypothetical protein [Erythrobacter sp.]